jgi:hypothetical protein
VITGQQSYERPDEYVPQGPIQGEVLDRASRNESFVLDFETCERQQRRLLPDGSVDTTVKQHVKVKHFDDGHDVEVDGNDDEGLSFGLLASVLNGFFVVLHMVVYIYSIIKLYSSKQNASFRCMNFFLQL